MVSDKFRHQLRHELEVWRAEGLVNDSQYEQLAERYQINTIDTNSHNRFIMILLGLGSILIGLGVITFVAANWQELPRTAKVTLLLSLFIVVNIAGFHLWRQRNERQQRLGHGLLILGALILGANMGLMGQMFHISNPVYELLLAWGVGVVAMAYSLHLTSLGVLSIILIGCGYLGFLGEIVFTSSFQELSWSALMGQHLPLLIGLIFIPLAYWCRSRWIFALAAIALVFSLQINWLFGLANFFTTNSGGWVLAIAIALPPALLWGYDDSLWIYGNFPWFNQQHQFQAARGGSFQPIARNLALVYLGILFYTCSFYWFWGTLSIRTSTEQPTNLSSFALVDVLIFSGLAIFEWLRLLSLGTRQRPRRSVDLTTITIGGFIAIAALMWFWHISIAPISVVATFIFNALLFVLAAGLIREGLAQGQRRTFWGGIVLLTLRILNWFILSATGLLFKSLMFILCGVGVIAIGLWFERYVRSLSNTAKPRRSS